MVRSSPRATNYMRGIDCAHYFSCLGGPLDQKLEFFRYKNVTRSAKATFLTSDCQNSSIQGVFNGGELIARVIFHAWMGPGAKSLNF